MNREDFKFPSADRKTRIQAFLWTPEEDRPIRGIVQITHGMQEFALRYEHFAAFLCGRGYAVAAMDLLGHGASVTSDSKYGYFARKNGNQCLLTDIRELQRQTRSRLGDKLPYYMLGHSMGSFLIRQYICLYGEEIDGAVISGTGYHSALEANFGMQLCRLMAGIKGWEYRSRLITRIAMGSYNHRFEPARTRFDWLTRDEQIVEAYRRDPRTQFMFTLNGFYNLFYSLKQLTVPARLARVPANLPVLFISGSMDPVGAFGNGVKKAAVSLQSAGVRDVTCRLYPNDRHEVLNELDRADVYADVLDWLKRHPARA
ncbi:MAG: alpha/beta hydrolase [Lachnospiraceae bacterium]|nr:alpha/beta hydrolase [Lachnospiraceae bacterium]